MPFFQLPAVRARQAAARVALSAFIVDRSRRLAARDDGADHAARALSGDARDGPAGPRLVARLHRRHAGAAVRRRRAVAPLRGARRARWRSAIALVLVGAAGGRAWRCSSRYQEDRLTSFLHPSDEPARRATSSSSPRSRSARARRPAAGSTTPPRPALDFLPEHHTDFIFAVVGETYGFAGAALVLSLYALLIWRALHILTSRRTSTAR